LTSRYLSRLRLSAFRNYQTAALDLDSRHVVLVGPNGAGKTNLLEAISLLAPGRGLRRATFEEVAAIGSEGNWAVAATVETPDGPADIGTGAGVAEGPRRVRINGANARTVEEMSAYLRVLWLTPAMDGLFTGPAAERRRFLDRLVTTLVPGHAAAVSALDKSMRHRNRLLEEDRDPRWIAAVEQEMAAEAGAVHFARADSLAHLQQLIDESLARDVVPDASFPAARLTLTPLFADGHEPVSSTALEAELLELWAGSRAIDRAAGRTLAGPHRVDFGVTHAQKGMPAALGSTGEQKALLIGLVLAHARLVARMTGIAPFLLLDEIAAHLDPDRRAALFAALDGLGTQCFLTGTDALLFEALGPRAQTVGVEEGRLQLAE
jgi:DNA replication and repair protein RecF